MAIDFIKVKLSIEYIKQFENNRFLDFKMEVNETTGEIYKRTAIYQGLTVIIRSKSICISGSLHYFYNDGIHNYNDFTYSNLIYTLNKIESLFGIDLSKFNLKNIEVGVNICLPFRTSFVLNNTLFHGIKRFKDEKVNKGKGNYRVATHDRYTIKIYDKGLQFSLPYDLLRFEIHFSRMADLKKYGITTLNDLRDRTNLGYLKKELLNKFDEVFLFDWTIDESMIKPLPKDFYKWRLPSYWIDELNKSNRLKRKKAYSKIIGEYSNKMKELIRGLIEQKINELIDTKGDRFTIAIKD